MGSAVRCEQIQSCPARILVVEDERVVAMGLRKQLQALGYEVAGQAASGERAVELAENLRPDLVLMDIQLDGRMDGVQAAAAIRDRLCLPIVYLTAFSSRDILERAKITEPFGYVLKPYEDRELHVAVEIALYKHRSEQRLRESERRYRMTLNCVGEGIIVTDLHDQVILLNPAAENITGWRQADAAGKPLETVFPLVDERDRASLPSPARAALLDNATPRLEPTCLLITKDGREVQIEDSAAPITEDDARQALGAVLAFRDVSESRRLEAAQRQAQKMELLGLLAGGIAHDFNNLLTPILGYASLLKSQACDDPRSAQMAGEIEGAARSAAALTSQMLAYAGKGRFIKSPVDLSLLVRETVGLLSARVPRKIQISSDLQSDLPAIEADAAQVQQVVLSLLTNAFEACGESAGEIHISTRLVQAAAADLTSPNVPETPPAGEYVVLTVSDSGCGMSEEMLDRIFDPFFTTKSAGRGLGLPAALGIVRGHRGTLTVRTTRGGGSTFEAFFPRSSRMPTEQRAACFTPQAVRGTVLVAEDEESERGLIERILVEAGLRVISVKDGWEAIEYFARRKDEIGCVLLDVTMPRMSGIEALKELRTIAPTVPIAMMSGYIGEDLTASLAGQTVAGIIQKPFFPDQLLHLVRLALANP